MIVFGGSPEPAVHAGELEIAGRRVVARALPFVGSVSGSPFVFDPVELRFRRSGPRSASVTAGPARADVWRSAFLRLPGGPVLVGPGSRPGEKVWGSYAAAAEGARSAGRAAYLLDPPPNAIPRPTRAELVVLQTWAADAPVDGSATAAARALGVPAGWLFPLLPGWTCGRSEIEDFICRAASASASFVSPLLPSRDGAARRLLVEARGELPPKLADDFFDCVHHRDWERELAAAHASLLEACTRVGITTVPPRPAGLGEPAGNAAAAARLEERARELARDEHRAALLHAAARWIDESGRDLSRVAREGNFRRVFPFGAELAHEAERALLETNP